MSTRGLTTLGGGCFWCLEAVFERIRGVERVVSGYAGGARPHPTYEQVCSGATGHAEVVQVSFDPDQVTYRQLLEVFFAIHDPTTLNRQGGDVGTQYRSVIFTHDDEQAQEARTVITELADTWDDPVVTEIRPLDTFYPAEDYHQGYYRTNPSQSYCQYVISPKVAKLRQKFASLLSTTP